MGTITNGIVDNPSDYVIGIDLGTTNSSVAIYNKGMQVIPIEGNFSIPSVVRFANRTNDEVSVGSFAKKQIINKPHEVFSSFKLQMTNSQWEQDPQMKEKFCINGIQLTPTDMATRVLSKIRETVQQHPIYKQKGTICKAIICVPAQSQPTYVNNIYEAAENAGFGLWDPETGDLLRDENGHVKGVKILEEPTAAAIAYGLKENFFGTTKNKTQHILVYDFGGGTFDTTLLKIETRGLNWPIFTVINKGGISKLGGDDFDWILVDLLAIKLSKEAGTDILSLDNSLKIKSILKEWAEEAKIDFSNGFAEVNFAKAIEIEGEDKQFDINIKREDFIHKIEPHINQSIKVVNDILTEAKMSIDEINRIVLVGGSCKGPWIREAIRKAFDKEPYFADNVDTIVAAGASYYGSDLIDWNSGEERGEEEGEAGGIIKDGLGFNYGFELEGSIFRPMLLKGERFMEGEIISRSGKFTNANDSGVVVLTGWSCGKQLEITQNENLTSNYNVHATDENGNPIFTCIGEFEIIVPKVPPHSLDIELTMTASKEKWLKISGTVNGKPISTDDIKWEY